MVALALLLELRQFVTGVVALFAESVPTVALLGHVPLTRENLSLSPRDLLASRRNLRAQVVIRPVLLIEQEASVIDFFLEPGERHNVRIVPRLEVIVLQKLLVLQMPVLGLNSVKLVAQGQVIFVSLLNFKDFGLQLRNEQVLLVGRQVHAIVILRQRGKSTAHAYVLESYTSTYYHHW